MKNKLFFVGILVVLLLSATFLIKDENSEEEKVNDKVSMLIGINENVFTPISKSELLKVIESETSVIYIGRIEKEYSKVLKTLYDASLSSKIESIYYIDIEEEKRVLSYDGQAVIVEKEGTKFYDTLLEKLGSFTETYTLYNQYNEPINGGYKTIYTPMVLFIKEGKILYTYYIKDISAESLDITYNIYLEGFKEIS